jgi:hypothetical protein
VRIEYTDAERAALLLVAGSKTGEWQQWYRWAIPEAEAAYSEYLKEQSR